MKRYIFQIIYIFTSATCSLSFGQTAEEIKPGILYEISTFKLQNPNTAIELAFDYLKKHPPIRPSKTFAGVYHALGTIYLEKGLTNQALEYILISKSFMEEDDLEPWWEIDLGNIYFNMGDWNNAKKQYEIALNIFSEESQGTMKFRGQAIALNNLGMIEQKNKRYKAALTYYDEAMRIRVKSKSRYAMMYQYIQYGQLYNEMDKISLALQMFEKVDSIAGVIDSSTFREIDPNTSLRKLKSINTLYKGISFAKNQAIETALQQFNLANKYLTHNSELYTLLIRNMIDAYLQISQSDSALVLIQNTLNIKDLENNKDQYIELLEIQRGIFSHVEDFRSIVVVDSIIFLQKKARLKQLNLDINKNIFLKNEFDRSRRALEKEKDTYITIIGILVLIVFILGLVTINFRVRRKSNQQAVIISKQSKSIAESNLKLKEIELTKLSTYIVEKNDLIVSLSNDLNSQLSNFHNEEDKKGFKNLQAKLNAQLDHSKDWERFQKQFSTIHPDFINQLKQKHPELTQGDLKVCCYLIMNQSTKEIAQLMSLSIRTIDNRRYRLKKKMNLEGETNLLNYLFLLSGK
ncbi:MAG: tetratricopeptide repeat protein [Bacteroidota bacterium]|nr:tetratricopeptide repeat protein [Bacteroidota bacterium]